MKEKTVKIAVYGSLKRGFHNHFLIDGALIDCKPCTICGRLFDTGAGYPAFTADEDAYEVQAELVTLNARILPLVDRLEGHPNFYTRVLLNCRTEDGKTEKAYVYTMPESMTAQMEEVTSGNWTAEKA